MKLKLMFAIAHLVVLLAVGLLGAAAAAPDKSLAAGLSIAAVGLIALSFLLNEAVVDARNHRRGVLR